MNEAEKKNRPRALVAAAGEREATQPFWAGLAAGSPGALAAFSCSQATKLEHPGHHRTLLIC